ncbi:MAG: Dyp-type peroxidase [Propionibacteriales bacterium]|nr:Dyp-type peroxidase [Propionibacteriales bacterium]
MRRRTLIGGAVGAGAAAGLGVGLAAGSDGSPDRRHRPRGFHGRTQPGVAEGTRSFVALAAFQVVAADRGELADTLRALTVEAARLVDGEGYDASDSRLPPRDTGVVEPAETRGTSVTVSVGASLFDDRYGLADRVPAELVEMPFLANDRLDPAWTHADLLVQVAADRPDLLHHALRQLARSTREGLALRWTLDGFARQDTAERAGRTDNRNLLGFKDGTANLAPRDTAEMNRFVWLDDDSDAGAEPAWTANGSYQVVRLIRLLVERWDRVALERQEQIIGRRKDSGAPLGGDDEADAPDFARDPDSTTTPADAHIRLARPRTKSTEHQRMLRKGFNFANGSDRAGMLDEGLAFVSYQRSLSTFLSVQERMKGELLEEYTLPFGGGFFFVLPGVRDGDDWLGRGLLEA